MKQITKKILFCFLSVCIYFLLVSCAIDSLRSALNDINKNGFHLPKWDLDADISIIDKNVSVKELLNDEDLLGSMMSGMADCSFDQVKKADLMPGGKYYYPDQNNFGLRVGDYVIHYPIDFPGSANMINGAVNASIIESFTDKFVYELDKLPSWPMPLKCKFDSSTIPSEGVQRLINVDLSSLKIDINGDGTNDVLVKGIYSPNAELSLNMLVERNDSINGTKTIIVPKANQISVDSITIEGKQYFFSDGIRTASGANQGLRFVAKDFISASDGDHKLMFDGTGPDFSTFNIDSFKFTLYGDMDEASSSIKAGVEYKLIVQTTLNFGENYNIICDINEMNFNLETVNVDISMLGDFESTSDIDNLASYLASNLSFEYAGIYFDAKSTLPLEINMTSLFDANIGSIEIVEPNYPINHEVDGDSAVISYFDMDGDNIPESHKILSFTTPTDVKIPSFDDTSELYTEKRFAMYHTNSNINQFLEQEDNINNIIRRPKNLFFVSYFSTSAKNDYYLGVRNLKGGLSIQSGLVLPISIKVIGDKPPQDILKAFDMDDVLIKLQEIVNQDSPIDDIKELGFDITCENFLPLGLSIDFVISDDSSSDETMYFSLIHNNKSVLEVDHGELVKQGSESGDYYVSTSKTAHAIASVKSNFKYNIKKTSTGELISNNLEFDGSFVKFLREHPNAKMAANFKLLESPKSKTDPANHIAVRISSDNYLRLKINVLGTATLNLDNVK